MMMYEGDTHIPELLRQVRLMRRFFNDVVDTEPYREHHAELHCAYMELLNEELAPHALDLASAVVEWEEQAARLRKRRMHVAQGKTAKKRARSKRKPSDVEIADAVTREHGETFALELIQQIRDTGVFIDAFSATRLMKWPDDETADGRYKDIEDEIVEKTFYAARRAIAEAFFTAATEVLDRERSRR